MTGGIPPPDSNRQRRSWPWILAALVFVVLVPLVAASLRFAHGFWFWMLIGVQTAGTGAAWVIPELQKVAAERQQLTTEQQAFDARVDTVVRLNDALDPLMSLLGNLAVASDPATRENLRAKTIPLVLTTAADLIGPGRSRACWFRLEDDGNKRLVPVEHVGRAGSPSTIFVEGTASGDAAIAMVLRDEDRLCRDIAADPPPGWDSTKHRDYRTFISVSVIASDIAYGMLTLDALHPGDLTNDDMRLLRLLGGALAVALAIDP